jgi:hypothetical protein
MKIIPPNYQIWLYRLIIIILIGAVVIFLCRQYVILEIATIQNSWQEEWRVQERMMLDGLEASSGSALQTSPILQLWFNRCASEERDQYESTLEALGTGLGGSELQYLNSNFTRCGTRATDQALLQAVALEREVVRLEQWLVAAEFLPEIDRIYYEKRLEAWRSLETQVEALQKAQYELDSLQLDLIRARQSGEDVAGSTIQTLLQQVRAAREVLSDATVQYREQLKSLSL